MSLLDANNEEESAAVGTTIKIMHCASCGTDYYTQLQPGQSVEDLLKDMSCPCGNSQLAEKVVDSIPNEGTES
jgi:hypothetical protein